MMRTTLEIDDDVLAAAKELALRQRTTAGKMISEMARRGIQTRHGKPSAKRRNGFEILPAEKRVVTLELVQKLLEESVER
jgi:hypothetical protein